jgi:tetratricopeptide (TPR) repeat protein
LQKARQVQPSFRLNEANAPALLRICSLVDGNPLGILLAAAWLEYFSPIEIAQGIENNLDFLSRDARNVEPRHFGMRAVFDSSFVRLDRQLQTVFPKLAVFRGGFNLPAAQSVAGADLRALIALADKSLLARDPNTGRYEMHELLRHYAGGRLAEAGESEKVMSAHMKYYTAFVQQRERQLISSAQSAALDEIQADFDNIYQAFSRALANGDFASSRSTLPGLYAFCDMRSRFYEGEAMFRQAAEGLSPHAGGPAGGAWALALLSWFDMRMYIELLESYEEITSQARSCLEQCRSLGDAQGTAASLNLLGAIAQHQGEYKTAIQYCQEAMQVFPQLDAMYWVKMRIGLCYEADQQYSEAIQAFLGCLQRGRQTGERVKTAWSLQNIGDTLIFQGKLAEAQTYVIEALALFRQVGTPIGVVWSLDSLGRVDMGLGRLEHARAHASEAAELARELHSASWIRKTHQLLLQLGSEAGRSSTAIAKSREGELSQRELEVLSLLKSELSGPDIARTLVVSLNTVHYHTKNIYRKLGARTRLEAIQRAKELGL